jgi:hypothetical protein
MPTRKADAVFPVQEWHGENRRSDNMKHAILCDSLNKVVTYDNLYALCTENDVAFNAILYENIKHQIDIKHDFSSIFSAEIFAEQMARKYKEKEEGNGAADGADGPSVVKKTRWVPGGEGISADDNAKRNSLQQCSEVQKAATIHKVIPRGEKANILLQRKGKGKGQQLHHYFGAYTNWWDTTVSSGIVDGTSKGDGEGGGHYDSSNAQAWEGSFESSIRKIENFHCNLFSLSQNSIVLVKINSFDNLIVLLLVRYHVSIKYKNLSKLSSSNLSEFRNETDKCLQPLDSRRISSPNFLLFRVNENKSLGDKIDFHRRRLIIFDSIDAVFSSNFPLKLNPKIKIINSQTPFPLLKSRVQMCRDSQVFEQGFNKNNENINEKGPFNTSSGTRAKTHPLMALIGILSA